MEKVFPTETLAGPRIELRKYDISHAAAMFAAIDGDRARLRSFLPWVDQIKAPADEEAYVRSSALQWMEGALFDFGIFGRADGSYLGNIGVHSISWPDDRAELGYWLSSAGEGQGLMAEAVGLLEAELFRIGFHRIEIRCNVLNEKSAAVPKRCGYELEGTLRQDTIERGARRNTMIWGKVRG
ncbi:MAG: N-acetyltransferase [Proteobacteria bacterium]|nr:MAG: N-acetyltransferase [Pseudomonadota bacterium]